MSPSSHFITLIFALLITAKCLKRWPRNWHEFWEYACETHYEAHKVGWYVLRDAFREWGNHNPGWSKVMLQFLIKELYELLYKMFSFFDED